MYGMLNAPCRNSYIISSENVIRKGRKPTRRRTFMLQFERAFIIQLAKSWLSWPFLPCNLHTLITTVCELLSLGSAVKSPWTSLADCKSPLAHCVNCCRWLDRKTGTGARGASSQSVLVTCILFVVTVCKGKIYQTVEWCRRDVLVPFPPYQMPSYKCENKKWNFFD